MWVYRRMLRISYTELKTNDWTLERIGETTQLLNKVRGMKLTFFGRVKRSSDLENTILEGQIEGERSRGKQRTEWFDNIRRWLGKSGKEAGVLAKDRRRFHHGVANALKGYGT